MTARKLLGPGDHHLPTLELAGLDGAVASTWDAARASVDKDLTDLKSLVDKS